MSLTGTGLPAWWTRLMISLWGSKRLHAASTRRNQSKERSMSSTQPGVDRERRMVMNVSINTTVREWPASATSGGCMVQDALASAAVTAALKAIELSVEPETKSTLALWRATTWPGR